ncbi:hypothetical protein SAMN02745181_0556 [Rubritalea squalenifaciens DSM 18772]|uniref:TIGR04222 domain-containing protein n=1 Tax=Rubritalea squalenifaciens DSM 18772 TaxID=1123071 RepID=A0A1M6CSM0_9BACT|nr:hypothetical protein [Rubritalea squalenifaciens]SHI64017.1 hypothetical protein SAMN02745181_0556 [Rubritalea squalenifaciens DSM 18772]
MALNRELWDKLDSYSLDEVDSALKFSQRLARENQWDLAYTQRVIEEYKRFVYLSSEAGHMVTPSDEVDQVWHLHLCYTRSYWEELCQGVLGKPLHHGPTKGGNSERVKYHDLYERTLESYRKHFGTEAPADIWPPSKQRFACSHFQRVDAKTHFILPKRRVIQIALGSLGTLALAGCTSQLGFIEGLFPFIIIAIIFIFILAAFSKGGKGGGGNNSGGGCGSVGGGCSSDSGCGSGCGGGGCGGGCGGG